MDQHWMEKFFHHSPVPFACLTIVAEGSTEPSDYEFVAINPSFGKLFSQKPKTILAQRFFDFFSAEIRKDPSWGDFVNQAVKRGETVDKVIDSLIPGKSLRLRLFPFGEGNLGLILRDQTQEAQFRNQIDGFLEVSIDMFCIADFNGRFLRVNQRFEEVLGYPVAELNGRNFLPLVHDDDRESTRLALEDLKSQKILRGFINRYRCEDGTYKSLEWQAVPRGDYFYASARDITESVKKEETLRTAAIIDPLTGLYNRNFFYGRIYEDIAHSDTELLPLSMIAIDIDHFKFVNDIWGHPVGDEILERTARLLKNSLRGSDVLCRIGGEEFVVLLKNTGLAGATVVAKKMHQALNANPHPRVGKVTASFGVAERFEKEDFNQWYKRADDAVYAAKGNGRNTIALAGEPSETPKPSVYVTWKESWLSGNPTIDGQHRELVEMGNHLTFLTVSGAALMQISRQIDMLLDHVRTHFTAEEEILRSLGFPGLEEHQRIHQGLLEGAKKLLADYLSKAAPSPIFLSFLITDLIVGHMITEDVKFFAYTDQIAPK